MYVVIMHTPYCVGVCHFLHIHVYTVRMNMHILVCTTPPRLEGEMKSYLHISDMPYTLCISKSYADLSYTNW